MVAEIEQVGAVDVDAAQGHLRQWRWTIEQYEQAGELGWFEGRRVELINGEILEMSPMGEPHAIGMGKLHREFNRKLPDSLFVRGQAPLYIGTTSAPEPDVAVVDAALIGQRLTTARLVVEVSDWTLRSDRTAKAALYASAQIPEYWILDVNARTLEVMREPIEDALSAFGWRYGWARTLSEDASIAPLCAPGIEFAVREMLL
jgi:Uma2 family endonuclease